ncbi:MAG TPA: hypothetical protein VGC87_20955 [Pyrinomonadaceae bacterium]|jgi:hypothetical protein
MRLRLRTAFLLRLLASLALALALPSFPVLAQQRRGRAPAAQSRNAERAKRAEAAALLVETADKARSLDDLFYRARVQALAADALWPEDERQARIIFRRAWEAAEASDKAEQEEAASEAGALPGAVPKVTDARDEVLRKAATRDARLADVFLRALASEKDESAASGNEPPRKTAWRELSPSGARRLALADELLGANETKRAAEVAAPLVNEGVSANLIAFILRLSTRSGTEADSLYLRLLKRAAADPLTDANAVLLLSAPVVSPELLAVIDEFGSLQFRALPPSYYEGGSTIDPANFRFMPDFWNLAAAVLSRPLPPRDALTAQELMTRFYATGRLLPYFEKTSSPHAAYAATLRARYSELFNEIEAGRREQFSSQFGLGRMAPTGYVDPLRSQADELAHATDPQERAGIALSMVRTAVRNRFWDRARRAAAEIEDEALRARVLSFIQVQQIKDITRAYEDDKEDDSEGVARFARGADVPPFAKAWGLAQAAVIATRKKKPAVEVKQAVAELINEAEDFASRVARGTRERVAAYGVVTMAAARVDPERAWGLLSKTVEAANSVEDFTGDDSSFDLAGDSDAGGAAGEEFGVEAEVFRLDQIFATMARLDFDKALAEARTLKGGEPEAFATIAVAKSRIQESGVRSQNPGVRSQEE